MTHERNPTLDQQYWRCVRLCMMYDGLWPRETLCEPRSRLYILYHRCLTFIDCLVMYAQLHYLWTHFNKSSFFELGHMFMLIFINVLFLTKLAIVFDDEFRNCSSEFFNSINLSNYQHNSDFSKLMKSRVENISKYFTYYGLTTVTAGVSLFLLVPVYTNYQNGAFTADNLHTPNITLLSSMYISFPLEHDTDIKGWCVCSLFGAYIVTAGSFSMAVDLYLFLITFHILGQVLILENDFESLPRPTVSTETVIHHGILFTIEKEMYDESENDFVRKMLVSFIQRHKILIKFTDNVSKCFGNYLLITYLFHMVSGCIILLELAQGDAESYIRYGPMAIVLFGQLIVTSIILEQIGTAFEKLPDSVYMTPWNCMNNRNQKCILILLVNYQKPITFKAKGIMDVGVKPMANILKSTFSYFTFLRNKKE